MTSLTVVAKIIKCKTLILISLSFWTLKGVIQTWHQEGRQYWRRFAMDEISVTAEHSEISSHQNSRHDAPLR
jgi:hypothetical protein